MAHESVGMLSRAGTSPLSMTDPLVQLWEKLGVDKDLVAARSLPRFAEATELVVADIDAKGRVHRLAPEATRAWRAMRAAAEAAGVEIFIVSAFRGIGRQAEIIERKLRAGQPISQILEVSAPPGCSEHHTGCAVDVGCPDSKPMEPEFEITRAFQWLCENAGQFGFDLSFPRGNVWGYQYEPWHWCYRV